MVRQQRAARHWSQRLSVVAMAVLLAAAAEAGGDSHGAETVAATAAGPAAGAPAPRPAAAPAPATRLAIPEIPDIPDTVAVQRPDVLVEPADANGTAALWDALRVPGVADLTGVARFDALLVVDGEGHPVRVLAVDPVAFRPFTPEVTANTPGVWQRLLEGDVVVRHDVAHHHGLDLGGQYELHAEHVVAVRIGAFASNGAPPLADVLVPWSVGEALGQRQVNLLTVAVTDSDRASTVGERVVEAIGGGRLDVPERPQEQLARLATGGIEPFSYVDFGDGMIAIDRRWVRRWIVAVDLPIVGRAHCNRIMVPQLTAAMREIQARGLGHLIHRDQFAGCWSPRHIDWDPRKPISMHAWGLAIDLNAHENPLGRSPRMDARIVEVFERWGFAWGGRWSRPDGMHFELRRIITPG